MSEIDDFKVKVDSAINQKTDPFSISPNDVGDRFKELADLLGGFTGDASLLNVLAPEKNDILVYDLITAQFKNIRKVDAETIPFNAVSTVEIDWTDDRKTNFGVAPMITVVMDTGNGAYQIVPISYKFDVLPPDQTKVTLDFGYAATGVIIIK